ncbi:hypothetical protein FSARC_14156 [Fusarium sarcochroum]|uniref:tyrosinase n=1 Tax=Fusarium sarcochroum TaxID=1208366 RepID=A0A8H4SVT9_9HYPO|nr:hypothetical protein FSARC_14156 [Fusarium sarcochroum]
MHLLIAWLLLVVLAAAQSYNYDVDIDSLTRRQDSNSRIVVKPLPRTRNGTIPLRPEIREMKADRYKWDLFILSMSMFQDVSQDDPASWYQVAGIHGVPFEPWNGVEPAPGASQSGYCTHNSVLFPLWHRPYLTLFEQELYRMANVIASMFPNGTQRQAYQDAARDFRMPYWDWAMAAPEGETHFPDVFWNATISQNGPRGVQDIRNPLYSYKFHPRNETALIWSPLKDWDETKRAPNSSESNPNPTSDNEEVNTVLLSKLPQIQQRLFILFSSYKDFNNFGNKAWAVSQNLSTLDSIESVHDIVHIYGGLQGHMTYVPLSSFDPLFLLHHCMTDRLVAIWQALNPDSWLTPMPAGENSFTTLKGEMQDSKTPLAPFFASDDGTFWDSDMSRTTEAFGYSYADTDSTGKQKEDVREELVKKITKWYGATSVVGLRASSGAIMSTQGQSASSIIHNGHYTEWVANVRVNVEALGGNFKVHFFLGEASNDSNYAGTVAIFAMNRRTGSETMISGTTPLTAALMKRVVAGEIPHLEPDVVVPFLREKLQFRVFGGDGQEVDPRDVVGLYVDISTAEVKPPEKETELPEWGAVSRINLWS